MVNWLNQVRVVKGKRYGQGTLTFVDGRVLKGTFAKGEFVGE